VAVLAGVFIHVPRLRLGLAGQWPAQPCANNAGRPDDLWNPMSRDGKRFGAGDERGKRGSRLRLFG
jgi:hypothetical protein